MSRIGRARWTAGLFRQSRLVRLVFLAPDADFGDFASLRAGTRAADFGLTAANSVEKIVEARRFCRGKIPESPNTLSAHGPTCAGG